MSLNEDNGLLMGEVFGIDLDYESDGLEKGRNLRGFIWKY